MSRGFGSTYGSGASDIVQTGYTKYGSDRRSYAAWIYKHGAGGGNFGSIFRKAASGTTQSEFWCCTSTASQMQYGRCNSSGITTSSHTYNFITNPFSADTWYLALLTHDQSSGTSTPANILINGLSYTSSSAAGSTVSTANNTDPYYIGNRPNNDRAWDGLIAHFAIWDDIILGLPEARMLYSGVHPLDIAPQNCVCYLPLDGIHNPETDFIWANGAATVTGAKIGTSQPVEAPLYIPRLNFWRDPWILQAIASAPAPVLNGPMVSSIW